MSTRQFDHLQYIIPTQHRQRKPFTSKKQIIQTKFVRCSNEIHDGGFGKVDETGVEELKDLEEYGREDVGFVNNVALMGFLPVRGEGSGKVLAAYLENQRVSVHYHLFFA